MAFTKSTAMVQGNEVEFYLCTEGGDAEEIESLLNEGHKVLRLTFDSPETKGIDINVENLVNPASVRNMLQIAYTITGSKSKESEVYYAIQSLIMTAPNWFTIK